MLGSWDIKVQDQDFGLIAANLSWPLYTGGKITSAIKAAGFETRIAKVETTQTESRLICLLVDRYYLLKLTQEALKVRQRALETCRAHLFNARKLEEQGMIAAVETMQAQTAVSDAQRETAAALKDIELARAALTGVIGKQDLTIHHLSSPLFEFSLEHDLDYYKQQAKDNYPAIVKAGLMKKLAEQNQKVQQAGFLPQIALLGSRNLYTDNLVLDECNYEWFIGLRNDPVTVQRHAGRKPDQTLPGPDHKHLPSKRTGKKGYSGPGGKILPGNFKTQGAVPGPGNRSGCGQGAFADPEPLFCRRIVGLGTGG